MWADSEGVMHCCAACARRWWRNVAAAASSASCPPGALTSSSWRRCSMGSRCTEDYFASRQRRY